MIKKKWISLKGHPDKICDGIADYILTKLIKEDENTRAGIECLIKDELLVIAGEISTLANIDYKETAKEYLELIGLDSNEFNILEKISIQSSDIALGVDKGGAGDQGIMYGYAKKEQMNYAILLDNKSTCKKIWWINNEYSLCLVDGKCQYHWIRKWNS